MEEEWKDIDGYDDYMISNFGNVWSKKNEKSLKNYLSNKYLYVYLNNSSKNAKQNCFSIHKLVALHFLDSPPDDGNIYEVDHINPYQQTNNRVDNLRWATKSQNQHNKKIFKEGYLIMGVSWSTKKSLPSPCYRVVLREVTEWKVFPTKYERRGYSKEDAKELARQEANRSIIDKMIELGKHNLDLLETLSQEDKRKYFGD